MFQYRRQSRCGNRFFQYPLCWIVFCFFPLRPRTKEPFGLSVSTLLDRFLFLDIDQNQHRRQSPFSIHSAGSFFVSALVGEWLPEDETFSIHSAGSFFVSPCAAASQLPQFAFSIHSAGSFFVSLLNMLWHDFCSVFQYPLCWIVFCFAVGQDAQLRLTTFSIHSAGSFFVSYLDRL